MMEVMLSSKLREGVAGMLEDARRETIRACAEKYKFSAEAALLELGLSVKMGKKTERKEKVEKREKPEVPLPFTGLIQENCCHGLKQNHGLLTQCHKKPNGSGEYCQGCQKQADKNASGKPNSGSIEDRMAAFTSGKEYRDPKGKAAVAYAKVMQKLKLTEEQVQAEATKQNIELPAELFNAPVAKRGRPKKNPAVTSDTESESSVSNGEPKKRGRPKKTGKPVEVSTTEDLFATIISEAKGNSPRPEEQKEAKKASKKEAKKASKKEEVKKEEVKKEEVKKEEVKKEEPEVKVKKFEFKGKLYYRTADNVLYDPKTQECMGVFNEESQEIDECEEEDEEEDE
jgi:hypothetical protein